MGMREDDYVVQVRQHVGMPGYLREIRHHYGDRGIDRTIGFSGPAWAALKAAAVVGDAVFWDALRDHTDSEFMSELGLGGHQVLRQLFLALPNL